MLILLASIGSAGHAACADWQTCLEYSIARIRIRCCLLERSQNQSSVGIHSDENCASHCLRGLDLLQANVQVCDCHFVSHSTEPITSGYALAT